MSASLSYFPFDISHRQEEFGLVERRADTSLGAVSIRSTTEIAARPVVFLHGVGMDWSTWTPLMRAADREERDRSGWILVDVPGFGSSDPLTRSVTLQEVGEAVLQAVAHVDVHKPLLVGHSMGGFLGLDMAASFPRDIEGIISASGAYSTIVEIVNRPLVSALRYPRAYSVYAGLQAVSALGRFASPVLEVGACTGASRLALRDVLAHPLGAKTSLLSALSRGMRPDSFRYAENTGLGYDIDSRWSSISCPLLATFGRDDHLVSARDASRLARCNPDAEIAWIDDAGHFAPMERPFEFLELISTWL